MVTLSQNANWIKHSYDGLHATKSGNSVSQDLFLVQFRKMFPVSGVPVTLGSRVDVALVWWGQEWWPGLTWQLPQIPT